jgi:TolA-binding protein
VDRIHRKELKQDKFALEVQHGLDIASSHRGELIKWGGVAVAILLLIGGIYAYSEHSKTEREAELQGAMRIQEGAVGAAADSSAFVASFPTQAEKDQAATKAFTDILNKYPGKKEGAIARFYLGVINADAGKQAEAEKFWKANLDSGYDDVVSQTRLSLAQLYEVQGNTGEAEKILRDLMAHPTIMVSKEQATIELARALSRTKPDEARKLLEPLRTERSAVSRMALTAYAEIGQSAPAAH